MTVEARVYVEVGGKKLPKGSSTLLALASANRDEAVFDNPNVLDVSRRKARRHLSFGHGMHVCIGAPLARLQLRILLEVLIAQYPKMTLASGQELNWIRTICFRGPGRLLVRPRGEAFLHEA